MPAPKRGDRPAPPPSPPRDPLSRRPTVRFAGASDDDDVSDVARDVSRSVGGASARAGPKPPAGPPPPAAAGGGGGAGGPPRFVLVDRLPAHNAFLFSIFVNQFFMSLTTLAPSTLGVYQVRLFFVGADEDKIGPANGALGAVFACAQLATMYLWGHLSDATGRPKALILVANVVCGCGATWFALATTYGQAMAARVVAGAFMASGVVLKGVLGMTLTKNAQAVAMAYRTLGAGVSQIVTPLVIGSLANPCKRWGWTKGCDSSGAYGDFLATHPFALSAAFIAAVGVVTTISNFCFFPSIRTHDGSPVGTGARARGAAKGAAAAAAAATDAPGDGSANGAAAKPADAAADPAADAAADDDHVSASVVASRLAAAAAPPRASLAAPPLAAASRQGSGASAATAATAASARSAAARLPSSVFAAPTPTPPPAPPLALPPRVLTTSVSTPATQASAGGGGSGGGGSSPPSSFAQRAASAFPSRASLRGRARQGTALAAALTGFETGRAAVASRLSVAASVWGRGGVAGADHGDPDLDHARAVASDVRERVRLSRDATASTGALSASPFKAGAGDPEAPAPAPTPWWRCRAAVLSICAYAAVTSLFQAYVDLVSLFGSANNTALVPGLSLPVSRLSWIISLGGACVVAFSLFAYPPLQRRIGVSRCATFGLMAGIPTALVPPLARYATPKGHAATLAVLGVGQIAYGAAFAATSTSSQILVNLCAPDGQIGAVNGAGNTLAAVSRIVGPLVTGGLWALAARDMFPNDQWLPFVVLAGCFALVLAAYVWTGLKDADMGGGGEDKEEAKK